METSTIIIYIWLTILTILAFITLAGTITHDEELKKQKRKPEPQFNEKEYQWAKRQREIISEDFKNRACYFCNEGEISLENQEKREKLKIDKNIPICYTCKGKIDVFNTINKYNYDE